LHQAAEKLGGVRALGRYLKVPLPELFAWMSPGSVPPPDEIFLQAVDLVLDDLEPPDQERAQRLRLAAMREDWVDPEHRLR
jgi:hypothetical protein